MDFSHAAFNAITLKSKTININVVVGAVVTIAQQLGLAIAPELVTAIMVILNIGLRFITKKPLEDK